ncbi:MAG: hypothetical protein HKN76_17640 [Saprospiraceae bacterium]|nr:hypothetical protein [Saprospiraceae bacterium]
MKQVMIEIIERTPEVVKVKMPFTPVPIEMNHNFFQKRWDQGYFKLPDHQKNVFRDQKQIYDRSEVNQQV